MTTIATTLSPLSSTADASANSATRTDLSAYGVALLRVALGAMFLSHGLLKLLVFTLPGTAGFFASVGFPAFTAYLVVPAEILAGIALLLGFRTRLIAAATLPLLLGALSVHLGNGWLFSAPKGGWEYPLYLVVLATAQALLGSGALANDNLRHSAR